MIPWTRPVLPPLDEFAPYWTEFSKTGQITNNGRYAQELEHALCEYLGVEFISLLSSGTAALIVALKALHLSGEVITTPFTFAATPHAVRWNGLTPVFVDIEPGTFNLDPEKIEAAVTPRTSAILPVHVYGNPCDDERIEEIAARYGLKVIYDAAHAFGVTLKGRSVLTCGDLAVLSFHASKVYHTIEGGAVISHDEATKRRIDCLTNFGISGETSVPLQGINGKMNEFEAVIGLLQLRSIGLEITKRAMLTACYRRCLRGSGVVFLEDAAGVCPSYGYFPVLVKPGCENVRDDLYFRLRREGIYSRRFFYPLVSHFPPYREHPGTTPVAEEISQRILCLPLYPDLTVSEVEVVAEQVRRQWK